MGNVTREEFFGFARSMLQNPLFREYWYATRPHRATLVDTSDEAGLGRMVDDLLVQLEDADIDEWWVVGDPPVEWFHAPAVSTTPRGSPSGTDHTAGR
ncbi:hypothetical protein GCM10010228_59990 [Streptomyces massasporeus]|nr:hypothetical protein GCM10010228_59990 [Streptomyces massasporeus]